MSPALASAALTALVGLAVVAVVVAANGPFFQGGVLGVSTSPGTSPGGTGAAATPATATPPVATPTPASPPPSEPPGYIDPTRIAQLRQSAWMALDTLEAFASTGNVEGALSVLGDTAPGLRSSGLRLASFPTVTEADIQISGVEGAWTATAGSSTMTSNDGTAWTFDYANRPLAAYSRTLTYGLFITPGTTQRVMHVQVTALTVLRSSVHLTLTWRFDTDIDAATFGRHELRVTSITLGSQVYEVPEPPTLPIGDGGKASLVLPISVMPTDRGTLQVGVYRAGSSTPFLSADIKLRLR